MLYRTCDRQIWEISLDFTGQIQILQKSGVNKLWTDIEPIQWSQKILISEISLRCCLT